MWSFDIHRETDGTYTWRLWASDGHIAAAPPEGFATRYAAHRAAERLAEQAEELLPAVFADPDSGHHRWRLEDPAGRTPVAVGYLRYSTDEEAEAAALDARRQTSMAGIM